MAGSQKVKLLPQARALGAEGLSAEEIAAALGVSARTVRRWASQDRAAGRPWGHEEPAATPAASPRQPTRPDQGAPSLRDRLQQRLERLVERSEEDLDDAKLEDRMLKICRVLEALRSDAADLDARMEAMEDFGAFCMRNFVEEEMTSVRRAIRMFVDNLKEEHS